MDLTDKEAALDAHCTIMCGHKHKQDVICLMECPDYEVFNHLPSVQPAVKDTNVLNNDYISRQAAIEVAMEELESGTYFDIPSKIKDLSPALPEKRTNERAETHACDCISRLAAIDATWFEPSYTDPLNVLTEVRDRLKVLPSAQPEIIRCKDCKYAEVADQEDNQDGYTCQFHRGSIWFSGSFCSWAERRQDDNNKR